MAIGKASDFKIFPEQFFGGMYEVLMQNTAAFNAASRNAIQLITRRHRGHYEEESFIKQLTSLVTRRDITSVATAGDSALTQDSEVRPKVNRKIGPIAQANDAWRKIARDPQELSFRVGQQVGQAVAVDYVDTAVRIAATTIGKVAALVHDGTDGTVEHSDLLTGLSKFGDASSQIVAWVMHSKQYFDLMQQSITDNIYDVGAIVIKQGTPQTFNRPVIVTDSAALITTGTPDQYAILGLVPGGVTIAESEEREIVSDLVTGLENLVTRVQGEYAFTVGAKGFSFDDATVNPTDAALATAGNWTQVATDNKSLPGILVNVQ